MAERRMFAKTIVDSDAFLDMSLSTQALYFHLSMRADDDGFINNPKKIARMIGSNDDEFKILIAKKFILTFESGVIVIKHWRIHNYIQKDRYKPTNYLEEKELLSIEENNGYKLDTQSIQDVRLGKVSIEIGKVSIEIDKVKEENISKLPSKFPFRLNSLTSFDKLSDDYINRLENEIEKHNEELMIRRLKANSPLTETLSFEEFSTKFLANGKKQKDFWMTFLQYEKYVFENEAKKKGIR